MPDEAIQSLYEKEEAEILHNIELKRAELARVAGMIEERDTLIRLLATKDGSVDEALNARVKLNDYVGVKKAELARAEALVTTLEPRGFLGTIADFFYHLFGLKTDKDNAIGYRDSLNTRWNNEKKQRTNELVRLDSEINEGKKDILVLDKQASELLIKIEKEETPLKLDEHIQGLEVKLSQNRKMDKMAKSALFSQCKQESTDSQVLAVRKELKLFLVSPSESTLATLTDVRNENPDYLTDVKLTELFVDVGKLYPEVTLPKEEMLPINSVKLIQMMSDEMTANKIKINDLERTMQSRDALLKKEQKSISEQKTTIDENKDALKKGYRLLSYAKTLDRDNDAAVVDEGIQEQERQAIHVVMSALEDKIQQIKQNLPSEDLSAIDEQLKQEVDQEHVNREGMLCVALAVTETRQQILDSDEHPGNTLFNTDIQWIKDPSIQESHLNARYKGCITMEAEIHEVSKEISHIEESNKALVAGKYIVADGGHPVKLPEKIKELIETCEGQMLRNNAVRKTLRDFLSNPTIKRFDLLQDRVKNDLTCLKNKKLAPLFKEAGELYPRLAEAMIQIHQESEQKTGNKSPISPILDTLESIGEFARSRSRSGSGDSTRSDNSKRTDSNKSTDSNVEQVSRAGRQAANYFKSALGYGKKDGEEVAKAPSPTSKK